MQHGLELDHAVVEVDATDVATLAVVALVGLVRGADHRGVLAADALELRTRGELGVLEEQGLVGRRGHARDRADLAVRDGAAAERVVDHGELGEAACDAQVLARGAHAPAEAPCEPLGARAGAVLVPATRGVEGAKVDEERVRGGVEVSGVGRDAIRERVEIGARIDRHPECISSRYDNLDLEWALALEWCHAARCASDRPW